MNRKQFAVATLFALVLLTLVLAPLAQQQGGGSYDPWLDYNEDGVIDVNDLHPLGVAYGTTGDSTKNVNVTNWPTTNELFPQNLVLRGTINMPWGMTTLLVDERPNALSSVFKSTYDEDNTYWVTQTPTVIYGKTYIYTYPAKHSFQILGRPFVHLTLNITTTEYGGVLVVEPHAILGTVNVAGQWTMISDLGNDYHYFFDPVPPDTQITSDLMNLDALNAVVGPLEQLAIRLAVYAYYPYGGSSGVSCAILCGIDTDYFTVNIPIVENP